MIEPSRGGVQYAGAGAEAATLSIDTSRFNELGLPQRLIEQITERRYPEAFRGRVKKQIWQYVVLALVLCGGLMAGEFAVFRWLAEQRTQGLDGGFHYNADPMLSICIGFFGILLLCAAVFDFFSRRSSPERQEYDLFAGLVLAMETPGINGVVTRWMYRRLFRNLGREAHAEQSQEAARLVRTLFLRPAQYLFAFYGLALISDLRDYDLVTRERILTHAEWTTQPKEQSWQQLQSVETGCWVFDKAGLKLTYRLEFADGSKLNLMEGPLKANDMALLEFVEGWVTQHRLPKHVAVFSRGIHSGKTMWLNECTSAIAQQHPDFSQRIEALVR